MHCVTHDCSATQSASAVQSVVSCSWQAPPVLIEAWRHVLHVASAFFGVAAQIVDAQSVAHGAPPSAPVPLQAHANSELWKVVYPDLWLAMQHVPHACSVVSLPQAVSSVVVPVPVSSVAPESLTVEPVSLVPASGVEVSVPVTVLEHATTRPVRVTIEERPKKTARFSMVGSLTLGPSGGKSSARVRGPMPRRIPPLAAFVLVALMAACAPSGSPPVSAASETPASCLSIAAWNDMHGQLGADEVQIDATRVPAGGVIAVADQVAALRATTDVVVVLDAGDLFTGPLDTTVAEGAPIIDAYNAIGVDAAAIGNHEFDFGPVGYARVTAPPNVGDEAGPDGPRGALFARMESAHFPFVSANLHRADGKPLGWPRLHASTHVTRGGFDVGVVGYTTIETPTTTLKPNIAGLTFAANAAASVAAEVHALRAAGAAPIVLLAHASLDGELPQLLDDASDADAQGARRTGELATLLDAMPAADRPDVIVGGHRHQWMLGRVRGVPIVSSDQHGVGLSRIRYCRSASGGVPRLERIERRVAMASSRPSSELGAAVAASVAPWQAKVKREAEAVIATLPKPCLARALNGTGLVEQVARGIAESASTAAAAPPGVPVVALMNSGGIRAPLRAGPLRYGDVFTTSPFENGIATCATTRAGLARTLANSVRPLESRERLPFGIAGAKVTLRRLADGGLAVEGLVVDGDGARASVRDDDPIWMAIPDFILWGGDALLEGVTCTSTATSQLRVRDAWRSVIAREQACDGPPKNVVVRAP